MEFEKFTNLLFESKQYKFDGSILEITGYYTGNTVKLDLSLLPEDVYQELIVDDEEDYWE